MATLGSQPVSVYSLEATRFRMSFFLTFFLLVLPLSTVQAVEQVGEVIKIQGDCLVESEKEKKAIKLDDPIFFKDKLLTGANAGLTGHLADHSELTLGENASLKIDEFVYQPNSHGGRLGLHLLKGPLLFVGGELDARRKAKVTIETPVATLGIRGTRVWTGRIDNAYGVLVLDGQVAVGNPWGNVELGPGEGTMISGPSMPPSAVKIWPQEKVERALSTVSPQDQ